MPGGAVYVLPRPIGLSSATQTDATKNAGSRKFAKIVPQRAQAQYWPSFHQRCCSAKVPTSEQRRYTVVVAFDFTEVGCPGGRDWAKT